MKKKKKNDKIIVSPSDYDIPIKKNILPKSKTKRIRKKRTLKLWVLLMLFFSLFTVIIFLSLKILSWHQNNLQTKNITQEIQPNQNITEDTQNTEYINQPDDKKDDYYYYITFPLISVNFDELLKKNHDTVGWINVNHTNINYPVVQAEDNDYYLNHSYTKEKNEAGWVFMDYRNNKNFQNQNTIIYAHSRLNKTMFGSLSKTLKESWFKKRDNHIIRISTPTENTSWQIFSVYKIEAENYYITTNFSSNGDYEKFLTTIQKRSIHPYQTSLSIKDRILTLSTCYSDTERTVVHAKLIKREKREN